MFISDTSTEEPTRKSQQGENDKILNEFLIAEMERWITVIIWSPTRACIWQETSQSVSAEEEPLRGAELQEEGHRLIVLDAPHVSESRCVDLQHRNVEPKGCSWQ
ncbi:hypothetical protein Q7C36_022406 [Tachysurus vachellii]|uniref:Uncharacterized protein n=1 Tax=Tachysurus vachellii TaxID=175792 RepID=A0AA88LGB3_TACVA|nr:hypothetical protein Q7C36_022406 [Tachysurus vachellii]